MHLCGKKNVVKYSAYSALSLTRHCNSIEKDIGFDSQHASNSSLTSLSQVTSTYISFGLAIADRVVRLLPKTLLKSQELVELMW